MNNVLPPAVIKTLEPLQDKAKEMSFEKAKHVIREDLGKELSEIYSSFEEKPVAAASLAQVHRAVLRETGEKVAVKLQYSHLKDEVKGDTLTIKTLSQIVDYFFPGYGYSWLVPEFENNMELELNFCQEGKNAERLAKMFAHKDDVYVPKVHWPYTTKRVLTMEYIDGYKVTDLDKLKKDKIEPLDVAKTVSTVFGDMIHCHGFVHCDPHAGNLFVRRHPEGHKAKLPVMWEKVSEFADRYSKSLFVSAATLGAYGVLPIYGCLTVMAALQYRSNIHEWFSTHVGASSEPYQLVVLDHGMYRRLDPEFRENYCLLWKALLLRDLERGQVAAERLGVPAKHLNVLSLVFTFRDSKSKAETGARMSKAERRKLREQYKDVQASDVSDFLESLPRDILFVMRSTNIVRSINLSLGGTSRSRFQIMGESAVRGILIPNPPVDPSFEKELSEEGLNEVNLPVSSELAKSSADSMSLAQLAEVVRLRMFLRLVDSSWGLVAFVAGIIKTL